VHKLSKKGFSRKPRFSKLRQDFLLHFTLNASTGKINN
jgi:hypothetical protein